jgi:hypothetical protein
LDGSLNLYLLLGSDTTSDRLGSALYRFGGYFQVGEQFQLPAAMIERNLLTYDSLHATHPRRSFLVCDVHFDVGGELAGMTVRAQVVGSRYDYLADDGQNRFAT